MSNYAIYLGEICIWGRIEEVSEKLYENFLESIPLVT